MNKARNRLRAIHTMAQANFETWAHSPRTWIMLLFVIALCYVVCNTHVRMIQALGYTVHWGETMFYFLHNGWNITMTSILFLITVSEMPRRMGYQYNMLIRATRREWLFSQFLYCLWMALSMILLVMICAAIFMLPGIAPGSGWTDGERIAQEIITEQEALVPSFIRNSLSSFAACIVALLPMLLFWLSMVLVVLFCSLMGASVLGVLLYVVMLVGNVVFLMETFGGFPMPIYHATLSNITSAWPDSEWFKLFQAMAGYVIALGALMGGMLVRVLLVDLEFDAGQRI